ncbi:hypothetical protein [Streptomyces sp. bgisy130]|uniref:hypothetical protein n=1 Tax=Streptomyces sp. bgisy130 TaxID=3413788 RepID=UPI003F49D449
MDADRAPQGDDKPAVGGPAAQVVMTPRMSALGRLSAHHVIHRTPPPDHEHLAELRLPPCKKRWRPSCEIHLPDGTVLRGRQGTVPSLLLCLGVLPFVLVYLVALAFSDSPAGATTAPLRTAWKRPGELFGRAALTESARGRFRVQGGRLDHRVAYAQAVAKYWER